MPPSIEKAKLDTADYRLLRELCTEARASDIALGERLNMSSSAVARRRKILEDRQVITSYAANLDMPSLGFGIVVIVAIQLSSQGERVLNEFETAVAQSPSVSFCSFVSGDADVMMVVHVPSFEVYDQVYRNELALLPHLARIRSSFIIREVQRRTPPLIVFQGKT